MKKLLYLSPLNIFNNISGGTQCALRNYKVLKNIFEIYYFITINSEENTLENIVDKSNMYYLEKNIFLDFLRLFLGYTNNLSFGNEKEILEKIRKQNYNFIFIEGSIWGKIYPKIKKINKEIKIITFFHNIEYDYFYSLNSIEKNFFKKCLKEIKIKNIIYNEKLVVKYSDYLITLNPRDTKRLYEVYDGKSDLELPITFEDKYYKNIKNSLKEKDYIFICWFFIFCKLSWN